MLRIIKIENSYSPENDDKYKKYQVINNCTPKTIYLDGKVRTISFQIKKQCSTIERISRIFLGILAISCTFGLASISKHVRVLFDKKEILCFVKVDHLINKKNQFDFRKKIYQDTCKAFENGYHCDGQHIIIDSKNMINNADKFDEIKPLKLIKSIAHCKTQFFVRQDDTFNVLISLKKEGKDPVGINMANASCPGGGVESGCPAQEESLCRRSNLILGLKNQKYPLPEFGGIYTPNVSIFREDEEKNYAFMKKPQIVSLVSMAAYDLRENSSDRTKLNLPSTGNLSEKTLETSQQFIDYTSNKIRNMLRQMALKNHKDLVLGAIGCGAFETPPETIAKIFQKVFKEEEFVGRFKSVNFAILVQDKKDMNNVGAFEEICKNLMTSTNETHRIT